ncbi:hypothetical protein AAG570_002143 [Ranatra chinensis]|uniref:Uncharacterized protein n=1 Tax=Ranatra chinensis TaxID=642074 RepID=A0ABD0Y6P8_9HEMI
MHIQDECSDKTCEAKPKENWKPKLNWPLVLFQIYLHTTALAGLWFMIHFAQWKTIIYLVFLVSFGMFGLTAGAHRLWAHETYKAAWPVRVFLMLMQTLSCQGTIYSWVLEHRIHHKHYGTDLDPFNYKRGFLYSQLTSHCVDSHPLRPQLEKEIDMTDIQNDAVVMFQKKYYWLLMPIFSLLLVVNAPVEYWEESILVSVLMIGSLRVTILLHALWLIPSSAIVWGLDPNNRKSEETILVFLVTKSLWPQYHYVLPWDYQCGEYGTYGQGCSTGFIRVLAAMRLAWGLTTITQAGIRTGLATAATTGKPVIKCLEEARTSTLIDEALGVESKFY